MLDILDNQPENQLILKHLPISQSTAHENSDKQFAVLNEMKSMAQSLEALASDGTNCCTFLGLGICDKILCEALNYKDVSWGRNVQISEEMTGNLPLHIHGYRDVTLNYNISEARDILKSRNPLNFSYELSEEFADGKKVFSDGGRERLIESLCQKAANKELCTWVGLYTCSPYTFVLGIHKQSFFLVDTHCIESIIGGNGNGILQSWPNVVERKVRFHFFTLNLNNNSTLPPLKHHTISFINASINIEKGARGSSFFAKSVKILQLTRLYVLISLRSTKFRP